MRLQTLDQCGRRSARRAVCPEFVPEPRREQAALRHIEGVRIVIEGLYLLDQPGDVTGEAIIRDRLRHLSKMVTVLDPLSDKGRLVRTVMERRRRCVEGWERRRVEQRLHTRVALSDIDDVPMDVIDRTPDKLSEICPQCQRARRGRVRVLDRRNLFIELIDDDLHVQISEVVDLGQCCAQHLLHADKIRDDQVDLIRADAADLTGGCVVEQICCCQGHLFSPSFRIVAGTEYAAHYFDYRASVV